MHAHTHTHRHARTHTRTRARMHTHTRTRTYTHTPAHTHTHTHIHTYTKPHTLIDAHSVFRYLHKRSCLKVEFLDNCCLEMWLCTLQCHFSSTLLSSVFMQYLTSGRRILCCLELTVNFLALFGNVMNSDINSDLSHEHQNWVLHVNNTKCRNVALASTVGDVLILCSHQRGSLSR